MTAPTPSLLGRWQMTRAEFNGDAAPELVAQRTQLTFTATTYNVRFDGEEMDRGRYELTADLASKTLTLHGDVGPNAGRTIPCIYQLVGDRLRICFGLSGVPPTDFSTAPEQERYLASYRRL